MINSGSLEIWQILFSSIKPIIVSFERHSSGDLSVLENFKGISIDWPDSINIFEESTRWNVAHCVEDFSVQIDEHRSEHHWHPFSYRHDSHEE